MNCRNQFTFYKSFDDVIEDMSNDQIANYMKTLLDVQFLRVKIEDVSFNDPLLNIVWKSQKHSIETSIKGYLDSQKNGKVKTPYLGIYDISKNPSKGVRQQEQGKEQGQIKGEDKVKEQVQEQKELVCVNPEIEIVKENNSLVGFEIFWQSYPIKKDQGKARMSFYKAIGKTSLDIMQDAIELQSKSTEWQKENGKFIPNPANWLDGERWLDEVKIEHSTGDMLDFVRDATEKGLM